MSTRVVNIHHNDHYDIFIGRPSKWCRRYREFILSRSDLLADLPKLKGKTLGCYCKPKACHGDVLIELMGEQELVG